MKNYYLFFKSENYNKKWFTFVELVSVIAILAILSTIWVVGYFNHLVWVRDSNRIAQIKEISDWLKAYKMTISLPNPENSVEIFWSWVVIWYQWYMWKNDLSLIWYNNWWVDPKDQTYFTYSVSADKKEFQLMAYLENPQTTEISGNMLNKANATTIDYKNRYFALSWDSIWILTDCNTNQLIQEIPSIVSSWWIEVSTTSNLYRVILSWQENKCASWSLLYQILMTKKIDPTMYCPENSNFTYNWHNYFVPELNVWESVSDVYSDPISENNWKFVYVLNNVTCSSSWTDIASSESWTLVALECNDWYSISDDETSCEINSCANAPTSYTYASFTAGTPTEHEQERQNYDNSEACYYTCPTWYTWNDCNIPTSEYSACTSIWQILTWSTTYSWCDSPDIVVCAWNWIWFTVAACNVWSSHAWTWSDSYWKYFQWWRNKWFIFWDLSSYLSLINWIIWLDAVNDLYWFVQNSPLYDPYTWAEWDITDNWWDITDSNSKRRWPCEKWYHIPKKTEWLAIILAWWWSSNWNWMINALKIPLAWYRGWDNWNMKSQWNFWWYWASSANGKKSSQVDVFLDYISPLEDNIRINWFTVRCVKD